MYAKPRPGSTEACTGLVVRGAKCTPANTAVSKLCVLQTGSQRASMGRRLLVKTFRGGTAGARGDASRMSAMPMVSWAGQGHTHAHVGDASARWGHRSKSFASRKNRPHAGESGLLSPRLQSKRHRAARWPPRGRANVSNLSTGSQRQNLRQTGSAGGRGSVGNQHQGESKCAHLSNSHVCRAYKGKLPAHLFRQGEGSPQSREA